MMKTIALALPLVLPVLGEDKIQYGLQANCTDDSCCHLCGVADGEIGLVKNPSHKFKLEVNGKISDWSCRGLQESVADVDRSVWCTTNRYVFRDNKCECSGGDNFAPLDVVTTLNPQCNICGVGEPIGTDRNDDLNALIETKIGKHTCAGLNIAGMGYTISASDCPDLQSQVKDFCCSGSETAAVVEESTVAAVVDQEDDGLQNQGDGLQNQGDGLQNQGDGLQNQGDQGQNPKQPEDQSKENGNKEKKSKQSKQKKSKQKKSENKQGAPVFEESSGTRVSALTALSMMIAISVALF